MKCDSIHSLIITTCSSNSLDLSGHQHTMRWLASSSKLLQFGHLVLSVRFQFLRFLPFPHHPEHCLLYHWLYIFGFPVSMSLMASQSTLSKASAGINPLPLACISA